MHRERSLKATPWSGCLSVLGLMLYATTLPAAETGDAEPNSAGARTGRHAAAALPVVAQSTTAPPIIDRELFFGDPEIAGAQISPDGKFIAFIKPFKGTRNIWVKRTAGPFASAKPLTAGTKRPIGYYFWSRDGKYILFEQDKAGDENFVSL